MSALLDTTPTDAWSMYYAYFTSNLSGLLNKIPSPGKTNPFWAWSVALFSLSGPFFFFSFSFFLLLSYARNDKWTIITKGRDKSCPKVREKNREREVGKKEKKIWFIFDFSPCNKVAVFLFSQRITSSNSGFFFSKKIIFQPLFVWSEIQEISNFSGWFMQYLQRANTATVMVGPNSNLSLQICWKCHKIPAQLVKLILLIFW